MTKTTARRGACPACGRTYALTGDGRIRNHHPNRGPGDYCPGSRDLPAGETS
ncbi:hypothetical protein [Actinacidiphila sp. ITFR-21]|uniref:hypothetical protein n=1 Tax=Actinacidiphila sp. ITFR-21 TaxID=3075199 RepID=UPI00288A6861|nr:hypothetical protein [Streptomyces sp. ITFR-21]WNI19146.1 hypothetical protein RLT57_28825 [Streptomyces sp. ITFR-21]